MKYDVFISYRREGGDTLAQLLYDRLTNRGYRVFLDIESLNAGKFNEKLLDVIEECKDIVVVLPPNALDRCHNEGDWLYREIEYGIKLSKNIIPVLMKNFTWPDNIPEAIAEIQNYNGILDNKDYFDAVIDKITNLLKSRPVIGGNLALKFQSQKNSFKNQIKRRKKILICLLLLLLCGAGIAGFFQHKTAREQELKETYVTLELTPDAEMSASDYYDAVKILEERVKALADGQEFFFETEEDLIKISLPVEVYHDADVLSLTKSLITRPGELSLSSDFFTENEPFHIERSSIKSLKLISNPPVSFDISEESMKGNRSPEEYLYLALTLNSDAEKELTQWINENQYENYRMFCDYEEFGYFDAFYYWTEIDETDNTIYFIGNCQYDNIQNTALYNFSNETFSHPFSITMTLPVKWENIENENCSPGKNQCNEKDLSGQLVRIDFFTYHNDFTSGEIQDTITVFKSRLDLFGIPYAFGYRTDNNNTFSVKLDPTYLNNEIVNLICSDSTFSIRSNFYELVSSYNIGTSDIAILQDGDGNCSLRFTPDEYWFRQLNNSTLSSSEWQNSLKDTDIIYLCHDGVPLAEMTLKESFDGTSFTFDNLSSFGLETVNDKHGYIYQLIETIICDTELPYIYHFENSYLENVEDSENVFYLSESVSDEVKENYEDVLSEFSFIKEYEVKAANVAQDMNIHLTLPIDESYASNVNLILQTLYEKCQIADGQSTIWIYFKENMEEGRYAYLYGDDGYYTYFILRPSLTEHKMSFDAYASSYIPEEDRMAMEKLINTESFYQQFYVDSYHRNEDGSIALK
ncbi:MAG: toll/interleukin-1 receptor domain-containing protein [Schaedlerella sp.]|nr:toll/interleukin-1 receptor domain-containing protein [Schaedlerella sp.]